MRLRDVRRRMRQIRPRRALVRLQRGDHASEDRVEAPRRSGGRGRGDDAPWKDGVDVVLRLGALQLAIDDRARRGAERARLLGDGQKACEALLRERQIERRERARRRGVPHTLVVLQLDVEHLREARVPPAELRRLNVIGANERATVPATRCHHGHAP